MEVGRGKVEQQPFARTIYSLAAKRFTGDLVLRQGRREYRSSWENGYIVAATSESPADSPGRVALAQGLVNSSTLGIYVQRLAATPGLDPVELLVELAKLTDGQRIALRQGVLARAASRIFALPNADFVMDNARTMRADAELAPIDLRWLIYLGLRSHYSLQRLRSELSAVGDRGLRLLKEAIPMLPAFGFTKLETPILQKLKSQELSLANLLVISGLDEATVTSVVYALMACNYLPAGQPQATMEDTTAPVPTPIPPEKKKSLEAATVRVRGGGTSKVSQQPGLAEETALLIHQKLQLLDSGADHFAVLGVPRGSTTVNVRTGYFTLAKRLHPDRLKAIGVPEVRDEAQRLFSAINKAFAVLSNAKELAHYEKVLAAGGEKAFAKEQREAEEMAIRIIRSEEHYYLGEMALRRNQFAHAEGEFRKACELNPEEGEYRALYAWCYYCNASDRAAIEREAYGLMAESLKMNAKSITIRLYNAKLLKLMGHKEEAIAAFRELKRMDPGNREGNLELRLLLE